MLSLILIISLMPAPSWGADSRARFRALAPESLGFKVATETDPSGRQVTLLTDPETGLVTRRIHDPLTREWIVEVSLPNGTVLSRKSFGRSLYRAESFEPAIEVIEIVPSAEKRLRVREAKLDPATGQWTVREYELGPEAFATCELPEPAFAELDLRLREKRVIMGFGFVDFEPRIPDEADFGNNVVARGCASYPGGEQALANEFTEAVNQGLRCLADLGSRGVRGPMVAYWRQTAAELLGYFLDNYSGTFTLACDNGTAGLFTPGISDLTAHALTCPNTYNGVEPPGVALNLRADWSNPEGNRSTLFHELVHQLELFHTEDPSDFDAVYVAQFCCFPSLDSQEEEQAEREGWSEARRKKVIEGHRKFSCGRLANLEHGERRR